ncbi:hypothetical protein OIU34_17900 [Pararhizobium sp. BT-229]|uniref:hypothetical protein n=1 Tax=Pararhizobium sp. BT-229 TaxID=2986923 RepID=UPI0021F6F7F7|nr:hypothetical protein [Pararhizobium sp. BT-229]MCV9963752.1 hypothetical protein [Pararhizobium sp. BT-229]
MTHEDALSELVGAECPVEWAFNSLVHIDSGTAASVFEHPADPQLVVRVSDYPDGWFKFADDTLRMEQEDGIPQPFRPVVHWIGEVGGVLVAVTERLDRIDDGSVLSDVVESALKALHGIADEWAAVERHAPGFRDFCAGLDRKLDLRASNFMRRGETLVFNDPYSDIPFGLEPILRDFYRVSPGSAAQPTAPSP